MGALMKTESLPECLARRGIEALSLPRRPYNALKWLGVGSIGQLLALSERELLKGRGLGRKCIEDIQKALWIFLQPASPTSSTACEPLEDHTLSNNTGDAFFTPPRSPGWPFIHREDGELTEKSRHGGADVFAPGDWLIPQLQTMEFVNRLVSTRSEVQQNVIRARYGFWDGHCKSLRLVGNEMGLTGERIRRIQNDALAQIRGFIGLVRIRDFVTDKIAAYLEQNGASRRGIVREGEGVAALAHGCSVGQASLAMAFFQDLFPRRVSVLAQCLFELEEGVFRIGEQSSPQSK